MKSSTFILVGAFVASGAIVYQGTMAGASQRAAETPAGATETELARSLSRTATPTPRATATAVIAAKVPALKLTLDQLRQLPRAAPLSGRYSPPAYAPPPASPFPEPTPTPPSEAPATSTALPPAETPAPSLPTPEPAPAADPWDIPTPPLLPSPPDNWIQPRPPTEQ